MTLKSTLVLSVMMVFSTLNYSNAQGTPEEISEKFFKLYQKSPEKAIDFVFNTNRWIKENPEGEDNVKKKLNDFIDIVGEYYGYEKMIERNVGENYKLVSYMVKYDRQPVRFTFIYYKPNGKWQLQNFQYDDKMGEELEEAGKLYHRSNQ